MNENHLVIYRKYRPKSFEEVIGQDHIVAVLKNALKQGKIAHAYLFSGPRGIGKTTTARLIAKAVNCLAPENKPCNKCEICVEFNAGAAFNIIEIDAASNRGIDEVRELRDSVRFSPPRGKYKVYVIDEAHQLTKDAFNALLKTLEEPPEHAIFILATTEFDRLPSTIVSRTQHFEFRRPGVKDIKNKISDICKKEGVVCAEAAAGMIAVLGEGSMRDAESILGRILAVEDKEITLEKIERILGIPRRDYLHNLFSAIAENQSARAYALLADMFGEGHDARYVARMLARFFRNALFLKTDVSLEQVLLREITLEDADFLKSKLPFFTPERLSRGLKVFLEAGNAVKHSPVPELPLEMAVYEMTNFKSV